MSISVEDIIEYFKKIVSDETGLPVEKVTVDSTFHELGLDSINSVYLLEQVEQHYKITFTPLYFWDYPTIKSLAKQLHMENFC